MKKKAPQKSYDAFE